MKTQTAINLAGSQKALADVFEITPSAVAQWGEELPEGRMWQLRVIKPLWFSAPTEVKGTQVSSDA